MTQPRGLRLALCSSVLLLGALGLEAQSSRMASPRPALPLAWGELAGHPIKAKVDAAPVLTPEVISAYRLSRVPLAQVKELINPVNPAQRKAYFKGNYIPPAKLPGILRHPALAKYIRSIEQAKNEFERKRLESAAMDEVLQKRKEFRDTPYFTLFVDVVLGDYDFTRKGFPAVKLGPSGYHHEGFDLVAIPYWPSLPPVLPMSEQDAERFISENPRRTVTMVVLLEPGWFEIRDDVAALTENIKASVLATAFLGNPRDGQRPVLAAFPTEAALSASFTGRMDSIQADMNEHRKPADRDLDRFPAKECGLALDTGHYSFLTKMMEKSEALDYQTARTPGVKARKALLEKAMAERTTVLNGMLKTGKVYTGVQTYPNGATRKFTLTFNKRDQNGMHYGTCTYANRKKAVVWAWVTSCAHGPCMAFDFYTPEDDEPGHSDDFTPFHVLGREWAVGATMGDAANYTSPLVPTRISLK